MAYELTIEPTSTMDGDNLQINISLTPNEQKFLLNDLISIEEWVSSAISGKLYKCKKRMINEWNPKIVSDPLNDTQWLDTITSREDYDDHKTKVEKDIEKKKKKK